MEKEDWSCNCCGKPLDMAWIVVEFHCIGEGKERHIDNFEIRKYCPQCEIMRWKKSLPYGMNLLFHGSPQRRSNINFNNVKTVKT